MDLPLNKVYKTGDQANLAKWEVQEFSFGNVRLRYLLDLYLEITSGGYKDLQFKSKL